MIRFTVHSTPPVTGRWDGSLEAECLAMPAHAEGLEQRVALDAPGDDDQFLEVLAAWAGNSKVVIDR
jgi:hypothetical protein